MLSSIDFDGNECRICGILTDPKTDEQFVKGFFALKRNSHGIFERANKLTITDHDDLTVFKVTKLYVNCNLCFLWLTQCMYSDPILDLKILLPVKKDK